MFKILLSLSVSILILYGLSIEVSGDDPNQWPYVEQTFVAGEIQSPINILSNYSYNASLSSLLYYRYWREESVEIKIRNNGRALHVHSLRDETSSITAHITGGPLFKKKYTFSHIHIYWGAENEVGSEHQIDSQGYPIEVQMIHYKNEYGHYGNAIMYTDGICIISYFGNISDQDNPKMNNFLTAVQSVQIPGYSFISTFDVHFHWLMDVAQDYCYYAYPGSITSYPFTQCATWIIYENTFDISQKQLAVFRTLIGTDGNYLTSINARMMQPFNNRPLCYV
ncbi:carbonic anhydrase 2-like [Rhopalosiphum maidis]|uniref:carbonic anhydrase 2-like n=1 Tax=Rhopalosiphum maidis TaxID=43146 RepID=UPI000EFDC394|nr:carbonic anhydrase 2-like [Rhopalosiphum maidis]